jgi:hypothetical protein
MDIKDVVKPAGLLAGLATLAAGTLAVGYFVVTRDREGLKRVVRVAAGTVERVSAALAETREELEDLWAQARDDARQEIEDEEFAAAPEEEAAEPAAPPAARRAKRRAQS